MAVNKFSKDKRSLRTHNVKISQFDHNVGKPGWFIRIQGPSEVETNVSGKDVLLGWIRKSMNINESSIRGIMEESYTVCEGSVLLHQRSFLTLWEVSQINSEEAQRRLG